MYAMSGQERSSISKGLQVDIVLKADQKTGETDERDSKGYFNEIKLSSARH